MKKECTVVMIPTKETSRIWKSKHGRLYFDQANFNDEDEITYHHLYVLSDEIKEGDWFMNDLHEIYQSNGSTDYKPCNKIIATTDSSLTIGHDIKNYEGRKNDDKKALDPNGERSFYIQDKLLPKIPDEFINTFCEKGGIWKVMVEYENLSTLSWKGGFEKIIWEPKVTSDNTISIYPVKESWSKQEVYDILFNLREFINDKEHNIILSIPHFEQWIKENLLNIK